MTMILTMTIDMNDNNDDYNGCPEKHHDNDDI